MQVFIVKKSSLLWDECPAMQLLSLLVIACVVLYKSAILHFYQHCINNSVSQQSHKHSVLLLFYLSHPTRYVVYLPSLIYISLTVKKGKLFFTCICANCIFFSTMSVHVFCPLSNQILFFYCRLLRVLYIFQIQTSPVLDLHKFII